MLRDRHTIIQWSKLFLGNLLGYVLDFSSWEKKKMARKNIYLPRLSLAKIKTGKPITNPGCEWLFLKCFDVIKLSWAPMFNPPLVKYQVTYSQIIMRIIKVFSFISIDIKIFYNEFILNLVNWPFLHEQLVNG